MLNAVEHLKRADPVLALLIDEVGPCGFKADPERTPFQGLIHAVAHQQLNGKAAATILARFIALFPAQEGFPTPAAVKATALDRLTRVGFSRAKAGYLQAIAQATLEGVVPGRQEIEGLADDEIVARLSGIKGVGRWSVEMFLMFGLGRPDVLPVHDFGIRQGFALTYGKRRLPAPRTVERHGRRWAPFRSVASWYLWRSVDLHRARNARTRPP